MFSDVCPSGPTTVMSEGTRNIVEAMKARGIRKVVACMSGTSRCHYKEKDNRVNEGVEVRKEMYLNLTYVRLPVTNCTGVIEKAN